MHAVYDLSWPVKGRLVRQNNNLSTYRTYQQLIELIDPSHCYQYLERFLKIIIFDGIYKYINERSLITSKQLNFRPGDSIVDQLPSIIHKIYSAFEEVSSHGTRAVFLDWSKAFHRVWHEGLRYKLQCGGMVIT